MLLRYYAFCYQIMEAYSMIQGSKTALCVGVGAFSHFLQSITATVANHGHLEVVYVEQGR